MVDNIGKSPEAWRNYSTRVPIAAIRLKRSDLKRLYQIVNNKQMEYRDRILSGLSAHTSETKEDFSARYNSVHDAFVTSISVTGTNNEMVHGNSEAFLDSPNIPEQLRSVLISTTSVPQAVLHFTPLCSVVLFLDFSRSPLLDFSNLPTLPTPNESNVTIAADNESWFTSTNAKLKEFLSERRTGTNWLHRAATYDVLVGILGVPLAIWLDYRVGVVIEKKELPSIISSAVFVYIFFAALAVFRLLFSYSRWVFPKVELDSERSSPFRHRAVWATIILAIVGAVLYDGLKLLLL